MWWGLKHLCLKDIFGSFGKSTQRAKSMLDGRVRQKCPTGGRVSQAQQYPCLVEPRFVGLKCYVVLSVAMVPFKSAGKFLSPKGLRLLGHSCTSSL